nr:hypothetical protein [uncultured Flavobacterium sp.]
MKNLFLLLFFILVQNIYSQNIILKQSYEVSFCGRPQTVKLIEYQNGKVEGFLKTELTKEKSIGKEKQIFKKLSISDTLAKKIIESLKNAGIESLKECNEDIECKEQGFLDGDIIAFKIQTNENIKIFNFSEIYPESQTNGKLEAIKARRKAQILATIIDKEIDLKKQFSSLIKSLRSGTYCYWSGITKVCIKHKLQLE